VYAVASRDIVFETFDGDAVVLDLASGKYFGFSESGSIVWEALSSRVRPADLAGALRGGAISAADLDGFVSQLVQLNLLVPSPATAPANLPDSLATRLASARDALSVNVYDDLADLVLLDPIHDVDEPAGWPAVKQAS
jgi:hypothetical protein